MRLIRRIVAWGFPPPVRQHPVRDRNGRVFAYLDLAWPDRLRAMEYDGERWHSPRRAAADDARDQRLRALGWTVAHMDRFDLRAGEPRLHRLLTSWFTTAVA
jgi:very-short-patch-repair endonuclease